MVTEKVKGKGGSGAASLAAWDPGTPAPDGAIRVTLASPADEVDTEIEAETWYWLFTKDADDVHVELSAAAVGSGELDLTKNTVFPKGVFVPIYSLHYTHLAVRTDADPGANKYFWIQKVVGDDGR